MHKHILVLIGYLLIVFLTAGCQGPKGDQGPVGPSGSIGPAGPAGQDTSSVTILSGSLTGNIVFQDSTLNKLLPYFTIYLLFDTTLSFFNFDKTGIGWSSPLKLTWLSAHAATERIHTLKISNVLPGNYSITLYGLSNKGALLDTIYFRHSKSINVSIGNGMHGDFGNLHIPEDFQ
jgi:hypothetical protein